MGWWPCRCCIECDACQGRTAPTGSIQLQISGVTNSDCTDCNNVDGTYNLAVSATCVWSILAGAVCSNYTSFQYTMTLSLEHSGSVYRWKLTISHASYGTYVFYYESSNPIDCSVSRTLTYSSSDSTPDTKCVFSGASVTITP